jgi:hypothetical protein
MVVYSVEYPPKCAVLMGSETGRAKLLLYNRPPNGHVSVKSIRLAATCPMSMGTSIGSSLTHLDHLCPLHTIALDTGELCIIFV